MNKSSRCAVYVLLGFALTAPIVFGDDAHHPDQKTTPAAGAAPQTPAKDPDKALKQMKENADKLRAQVDKIAKTKDPAERQKLMQEHMQTLRASMATAGGMMGGMGGGPGAGMGMGGGMMMDCPMMGQMMGGGMQGEGMMQRMQQMEKRMDMMQMMMEQMQKPAAPGKK
jgi:hypothetical protein